MAKTFTDINGRVIEIIDYETSLDTNEDIISGDISNYLVIVGDYTYEVDQNVYDAVSKYIE